MGVIAWIRKSCFVTFNAEELHDWNFSLLYLANSPEGIAARHYVMPDQEKLMPLWPVSLPNMASFDAVTSVHFSVHWGQKLLGTKAVA